MVRLTAVVATVFVVVLVVSGYVALSESEGTWNPSYDLWYEDGNVFRKITWQYGDFNQLELAVPVNVYDEYQLKTRYSFNDVDKYITEDDSGIAAQIVEGIEKISQENGYVGKHRVNLIGTFVQSLRYIDDGNIDTPRFPVETVFDGGGDCEDTSILLAAILDLEGYDVVLFNVPDVHTAVGISCVDCEGTFIEYGGTRYYYIETSLEGTWEIGRIPEDYKINDFRVLLI